jgi:hypothetical protein
MSFHAHPRNAIAPRDASPAARRNTATASVVVGYALRKQLGLAH